MAKDKVKVVVEKKDRSYSVSYLNDHGGVEAVLDGLSPTDVRYLTTVKHSVPSLSISDLYSKKS